MVVEILARSAIANTSSREVKIASVSERWCVKYSAARLPSDFGRLHNLVGGGKNVGDIFQRRADSKSAVSHGLRYELPHLLELLCRRSPIHRAHYVVAHAAGTDKRAEVDGRPGS